MLYGPLYGLLNGPLESYSIGWPVNTAFATYHVWFNKKSHGEINDGTTKWSQWETKEKNISKNIKKMTNSLTTKSMPGM